MSIEEAIAQAVQKAVKEALALTRPAATTPDELLSVGSAAELAEVSEATIRRWITQGLLKRYGSARVIRVRRDDVLAVRPPEPVERSVDDLTADIMGGKR